MPGGWACYALEERLVLAFSWDGVQVYRLATGAVLPAGRHRVEVLYQPSNAGSAVICVTVDYEEAAVAEVTGEELPGLDRKGWSDADGTLWFSLDSGYPLSTDYNAPFAFSGRVLHAVFIPLAQPGRHGDKAIANALKYE